MPSVSRRREFPKPTHSASWPKALMAIPSSSLRRLKLLAIYLSGDPVRVVPQNGVAAKNVMSGEKKLPGDSVPSGSHYRTVEQKIPAGLPGSPGSAETGIRRVLRTSQGFRTLPGGRLLPVRSPRLLGGPASNLRGRDL